MPEYERGEFDVAWETDDDLYRRRVSGYKLELEGWEWLDLFIWKSDGDTPGWTVSEVSTGRALGRFNYAMTRKDAEEIALIRLNRAGVEQVDQLLAQYAPEFAELKTREADSVPVV